MNIRAPVREPRSDPSGKLVVDLTLEFNDREEYRRWMSTHVYELIPSLSVSSSRITDPRNRSNIVDRNGNSLGVRSYRTSTRRLGENRDVYFSSLRENRNLIDLAGRNPLAEYDSRHGEYRQWADQFYRYDRSYVEERRRIDDRFRAEIMNIPEVHPSLSRDQVRQEYERIFKVRLETPKNPEVEIREEKEVEKVRQECNPIDDFEVD